MAGWGLVVGGGVVARLWVGVVLLWMGLLALGERFRAGCELEAMPAATRQNHMRSRKVKG